MASSVLLRVHLVVRAFHRRCHGGGPAAHVVAQAERAPGTLVAMTTHGRSGVRRWVIGSVTDQVINYADGPVLVVRAR